MKRWLVLFCGLIVELCLGGVYSWSVFAEALQTQHSMSAFQTQLAFGALFAVFTGTMVAAGRLLKRIGPRPMVLLAGLLYGGGYLVAGLSGGEFTFVLLGIGGLCGAGVGIAYVTILSTILAWFPRRKGLATGLIVAAFGGGAMVMSALASNLESAGFDVLAILRAIGGLYGGLVVAAAFGLAQADKPVSKAAADPEKAERVFSMRLFWLLCVGMFAGTFAGMLVIGSLKPIGLSAGVTNAAATVAVSIFAAGNAIGRVTWGVLHDRWGIRTLPLALFALGFATLALLAGSIETVFLAATFVVGFGFGACFVLYAAQVAASFGSAAVATVYPVIFLFYGLSSLVGPMLAGLLFDNLGTYAVALTVAGLTATTGGMVLTLAGRRKSAFAAGRAQTAQF